MPTLADRAGGVLLHVTSLPGGTLGPDAFRFVDWLAEAGQRWWQMLPIGPTVVANSPYMSPSAFAGGPHLLAPARGETRGLEKFERENADWLADFAAFSAIKERHPEMWCEWPKDVEPDPDAVRRHVLVQFEFDRQWSELRSYCRDRGIGLIGDVPIFVSYDSADVWAHPELFQLDRRGRRIVQAGVPPDYFSRTGQLWGNPLYRWPKHQATRFRWWISRFRRAFRLFDAVRIDHFIGFHNYWSVPGGDATAERGRWMRSPGRELFRAVLRAIPGAQIIAEDLGQVTPPVKKLRDEFGFPGMRVLQFAFGDDPEGPNYQPHNYVRNCVTYTGTHDNNTTVGWWTDRGGPSSTRTPDQIGRERAFTLRYLGTEGREIHWDLIRLAWSSVAQLAIAPAQDLLGLGAEARMNLPGTIEGNWSWRLQPGQLTPPIARRLRELTGTYGRLT